MTTKSHLLQQIKNGLVVSVQPVDYGPLDRPEIVASMCQAAVAGGATAVRIQGVHNVAVARKYLSVPIIGIVKYDLEDSPVRITPFLEDIRALAAVGADVIAIDGTQRIRPVDREKLVAEIKKLGKLVMAGCSTKEDGDFCAALGCDIIGTTLSGYTDQTVYRDEPDFELLNYYVEQGYFVMAEGRYNTPELVAQAFKAGAASVTVGTVLTRLEVNTATFVKSCPQKS